MSWLELKLRCSKDAAAALESQLWESGAVSVTMIDAADEPLFEPGVGETPLWHELVLTGLYEGDRDAHEIQVQLAKASAPEALPPLHFEILPEQDWVRSWLDDFKPMRFGRRTWVCPSWWSAEGQAAAGEETVAQTTSNDDAWQPEADDARAWSEQHQDLLSAMTAPGQVVLKLDPGLAFGTGTHPTTSLCLQWLDGQELQGQRLIDFGCGSGILGIAALLLGAESVIGIDNDPQALLASVDNCHKNQVALQRFPLFLPEQFQREQDSPDFRPVDGVAANILAGTLIELAPLLSSLVRPAGWILLSGILREQAEAVQQAYAPWFGTMQVQAEDDWVRISGKRQSLQQASEPGDQQAGLA